MNGCLFFSQLETGDEGILLTITSEILRTAGIAYRFEKLPVSRIFDTVLEDIYACFPGVFRTPDRETLYRFSSLPIYQDTPPHYVIRRADQSEYADIHTIKDLLTSEKTLGLAEKYSYGSWVDKNVKEYRPKSVTVNFGDDQRSFYRMLAAGRFDYFFSSAEEANYLINSTPENTGTFIMKELSDAPEGNIRWILFNKKIPPELLTQINEAIGIVTGTERYRELVRKLKE
ncbi:MAG TPA: transporter substrate-binding domain-containing protein [Treponemataceae bacterium]|nr:transporter substrate-binding domain-containing protein [Treponemataceae bacterium]